MNWLKGVLLRLAAKFNPQLARMLREGGTLDRLTNELALHRERRSSENREILSRLDEVRQAQAMSGAGPMLLEGARSSEKPGVFREAIAELELALEDRGWKREQALSATEFSRYGIQQIMLIARLYKIKNPLVRRAIEISGLYVWGRGYEVTSDDPDTNDVLKEVFYGQDNAPTFAISALIQHQEATWTDGNIFFVAFTDEKTGQVIWRTIDPTEIAEIVTDPDDGAIEMLFHRHWSRQVFNPLTGVTEWSPGDEWYPAIQYDPAKLPKLVKGKPLQASPIYHCKVGGLPKWHFGCPKAYPLIDWARAIRRFLENWATITDALAFFAWNVETVGGAPAIAALKQTFATTLANDGTQIETNPTPTSGAAWISGPGNKITPMKTAGMTTGPEECRRLVLMLCAGSGWPETFFGDASTGSLATAQSLDRPTELKILSEQECWKEWIGYMGQYSVDRSSKAPKGRLYEAAKKPGKKAEKPTIKVSFPAVLEHDISKMVSAIVEAATLNGFEPTGIDERTAVGLLLSELGVDDWQTVLEEMYPADEYEDVVNRTDLLKVNQENALNAPPPPPAPMPGAPGSEGPAGAAPHPPMARKPHPKRISAGEAASGARLERAVKALVKASEALRAKRAA